MVRTTLVLTLALVLAGHAAATSVPGLLPEPGLGLPSPHGRLVAVDPVHAAWSIDHGLSLAADKGVTTPGSAAKSVCTLGDADRDGFDDILIRHPPGQSGDGTKFEALAGPDFTRSLWRAEPKDHRLMKCGADVTDDGVPDPITVGDPVPVAAEPVPSTPFTTGEAATTTSTPLDGAQGGELAQIEVDSSTQEATVAPVEAGSATGGTVVPAGEGALLVIGASESGASVSGAQELSAGQSQATVQVVDESGTVLGTIETPPAADALAAAPAPAASEGGLPGIVVLTETQIVPVDQVPVGVPVVTLFEGDGTQQWSAEQAATAGVPVVLPDAGDVDGDGVPDLIYATIPGEVETVPGGGYQVLSGADGSTLIGFVTTQGGLVTALPLGDVAGDDADEVLVITQPASGGALSLSAQEGNGEVAWSVEVGAGAEPANAQTDEAGNTVGFTDVTGDGVADVVVTLPDGDGLAVEVIDGATGETVWEGTFEGADSVTTTPSEDGSGDDLIVVDVDDGLAVEGVDGASGETEWQTGGQGAGSEAVTVTPVGDVDGDGTEDVLVTIGTASEDGFPDPDQPGSSYIVSGDDGAPLWSGSNSPDGSSEDVIALHAGPGGQAQPANGSARLIWLGLLALAVVGAGVFVARKRK